MPSLDFLMPSALPLPPGLTPAAANPVAPAGSDGESGFASLMAVMGEGAPSLKPSLAQPVPPAEQVGCDMSPGDPLPVPLPGGTNLPPDRPDFAALPAALPPNPAGDAGATVPATPGHPVAVSLPEALPPVPVEQVMVGKAALPSAPKTPSEGDKPDLIVLPGPQPEANGTPVEAGQRDWRLRGASALALARTIVKPLPAPVPPPEMVEEPASAVPAMKAAKKEHSSLETPVAAEAIAVPPLPSVLTALATNPVPVPVPRTGESAGQPSVESRPAALPVAGQSATLPQFESAGPGSTHSQAPAVPSPAVAALPHNFTLPPEMAHEVAQLVRAVSHDGSEPPAEHSPPFEPASLPPLPQAAAQSATSLHASFVPSHRPVIDTGRAEWLQNMIDRIAEMPQADGKREAQLRLVPDALGPVEVKIEQREQRLHVTMNAQTPEARQLLSDAAPRLQELAEARGIRFVQTGFGGADAQDRRSQPDHQPATPLRPRPADVAADPESDDNGDLIA